MTNRRVNVRFHAPLLFHKCYCWIAAYHAFTVTGLPGPLGHHGENSSAMWLFKKGLAELCMWLFWGFLWNEKWAFYNLVRAIMYYAMHHNHYSTCIEIVAKNVGTIWRQRYQIDLSTRQVKLYLKRGQGVSEKVPKSSQKCTPLFTFWFSIKKLRSLAPLQCNPSMSD